MFFSRHKKQKEILIELDRGMASISSILQNMIKMQGSRSSGKLKIAV